MADTPFSFPCACCGGGCGSSPCTLFRLTFDQDNPDLPCPAEIVDNSADLIASDVDEQTWADVDGNFVLRCVNSGDPGIGWQIDIENGFCGTVSPLLYAAQNPPTTPDLLTFSGNGHLTATVECLSESDNPLPGG